MVTEEQKGRVVRVRASDNPLFRDNICMKGIYSPKGFAHPDRILYPLKRVGERGSGKFERVTWDEAMADIGVRLKGIIEKYGPEAWAVSTSQWNTGTDCGLSRRLMNHIGTPNFISGVALCAGNTAAVNRMVYGWMPMADFNNTNCIVLIGHNPTRHSWSPIYSMIRARQARGAKLIVLDPRRSDNAGRADIWLPLKAGSDTAMLFGWLKVIIDEELYDKDFVRDWTVGFEDLRRRVDEFPLARVAELTGCEPDQIAAAARMYATTGPAVIPWTPITDQQRNSTSGIRLQCILRAICGYVDVVGGETLQGLNPDIIPETDIEMHEVLPEEQKLKQLGNQEHPAFTYRGQEALREPMKRVWGREYINQVVGCFMANPNSTFKAMAGKGPYPVKAFIFMGNNPLLSYANMPLILEGMMAQELIVAHEQFMTPSAQLADYILPGDSWLERPWLTDLFGWMSLYRPGEKSMEPPGECESTFSFLKRLAGALDRPEVIPWESIEELYDWRLEKTGMTFDEFAKTHEVYFSEPKYRKYLKTGFATPSGKVELSSSILGDLGFDPLPYFRQDPKAPAGFDLKLFSGVREDGFFQTGHRHIPEMREKNPEPVCFLSEKTATDQGLKDGDWIEVETEIGRMSAKLGVRDSMPDDLLRVPHGWWKPEAARGLEAGLSAAFKLSDAQLTGDHPDYWDQEQGIPHFKGVPCRVHKVEGVV
ncbi:MAG: molybdopterin-dependent oxidoreductase [Myxococcota bacterium]